MFKKKLYFIFVLLLLLGTLITVFYIFDFKYIKGHVEYPGEYMLFYSLENLESYDELKALMNSVTGKKINQSVKRIHSYFNKVGIKPKVVFIDDTSNNSYSIFVKGPQFILYYPKPGIITYVAILDDSQKYIIHNIKNKDCICKYKMDKSGAFIGND